ncbi:hypothetical protein COO91_00431 [Nostoc flagelliforme CCNUN1]|uniref:Uncharacterized protein n=1 Tax=Nostoc flagelliforme CCNUN1 TaxID=2038116 RepID=A0A2K8SGL2_9NOSO|nr:hypothetical protein COO91_00431 [Nostoc flagelliforme CCNUN1]
MADVSKILDTPKSSDKLEDFEKVIPPFYYELRITLAQR